MPVRIALVVSIAAVSAGAAIGRAAPHPSGAAVAAVVPRPRRASDSLVVTTAWLAAHLHDPRVVVLDAAVFAMGEDTSYARGHIPGARLLDSHSVVVQRDGLDSELPDASAVRDVFEPLGISDSTRVVVYAETAPTASRVLFTLDYIGHAKSSYLDGGMARWRAEGRPVTRDVPVPVRGHITPTPHPEVVATAASLTAPSARRRLSLIDTRSDGEYAGTATGRRIPSGGHLPGARQLQWEQLFQPDGTTLLDRATLRALFADRVRAGDTVVTYCWVGYRASMTYFVARYLGYPARMYDGSYQDWANRRLPVRRGTTP